MDIWIPVKSLAEATGVAEADIRAALAGFPMRDSNKVDTWIRLRTEEEVNRLVAQLRSWHQGSAAAAAV